MKKYKLFELEYLNRSWAKSFWVSWEEGTFSDVSDTTVKLNYSFKTNTATTMGRSSILERINIFLDSVRRNVMGKGSFLEEFWFVDSLSTTSNLLTSHEEIIRVSIVRVVWVKHGVERSGICGISIQHKEVGIILFSNNST